MKKVRLLAILSIFMGLVGTGITLAYANSSFWRGGSNFYIDESGTEGAVGSLTEIQNSLLGAVQEFTPRPVLPTDINGWITQLLAEPNNNVVYNEFLKWLETGKNVDAFVQYIITNPDTIPKLGLVLNKIMGLNDFLVLPLKGENYDIVLNRVEANNLSLRIEDVKKDKDNPSIIYGALFDDKNQIISSISVEDRDGKKTATIKSQGQTSTIELAKNITAKDIIFTVDGAIELDINDNSTLIIKKDGILELKVAGKTITIEPGETKVNLSVDRDGNITITGGNNPAKIVVETSGRVSVTPVGSSEPRIVSSHNIGIKFNSDGAITITGQDTGSFNIDPQGRLVSPRAVYDPEGQTITLPSGQQLSLPPGSTVTRNPDGSVNIQLSNGTTIVVGADGSAMTITTGGKSFGMDISRLSFITIGVNNGALSIDGIRVRPIDIGSPQKVFSVNISHDGKIEVSEGEVSITVNGVKYQFLGGSNGNGIRIIVGGATIYLPTGAEVSFDAQGRLAITDGKNTYKMIMGSDGKVNKIMVNGREINVSGIQDLEMLILNNPGQDTINGGIAIIGKTAEGGEFSAIFVLDRNGEIASIKFSGIDVNLPPGAQLGFDQNGNLVVSNAGGVTIATISAKANGTIEINGTTFEIGRTGNFKVSLGIGGDGSISVKVGEQTVGIPVGTRGVSVGVNAENNLVISYIDPATGQPKTITIQGNPITGEPEDYSQALTWLETGTQSQKQKALEYLMKKGIAGLNAEQKNKLAGLLGKNYELMKLFLGMDGGASFLRTVLADVDVTEANKQAIRTLAVQVSSKILKDVNVSPEEKLKLAERLMVLISELLKTAEGKSLLREILTFLFQQLGSVSSASYSPVENLLSQYFIQIAMSVGGYEFLEGYIIDLATSAVRGNSVDNRTLETMIKTMQKLGFESFLLRVAAKLDLTGQPLNQQSAEKIRQIMAASATPPATSPQGPPGPNASLNDWFKWLEQNPDGIAQFMEWLGKNRGYIDDFIKWMRERPKVQESFIKLLGAGKSQGNNAARLLVSDNEGLKFIVWLLEGRDSPWNRDSEEARTQRRNLAQALVGLEEQLKQKARDSDLQISRAAVGILLAIARLDNKDALNALEALKALAGEGVIPAIQAIQYLITDSSRPELIDELIKFLKTLASKSETLRNRVFEALVSLVKDGKIDLKIRKGAVNTLIEIAKSIVKSAVKTDGTPDEATRIAVINKLWELGIWFLDPNNPYKDSSLANLIIKFLGEIKDDKTQLKSVSDFAAMAYNDLDYRSKNNGKAPPPNQTKNNNPPSSSTPKPSPNPGSGATISGSAGPGGAGNRGFGRGPQDKGPGVQGDTISGRLKDKVNGFKDKSANDILEILRKRGWVDLAQVAAFKKINRKYAQKLALLREKLKKLGLSDKEIEGFLKLSAQEKEAFLKEKGIDASFEGIEKEIEEFLNIDEKDTEKRREYLKEFLGLTDADEQDKVAQLLKVIEGLTDKDGQREFLVNEVGLPEWTANFILEPKSVDLSKFYTALEKAEEKLGINKDKMDATKLSEKILEALLSGEITGENAGELIEDTENPGKQITRIEALLRKLLAEEDIKIPAPDSGSRLKDSPFWGDIGDMLD
jgi:hypothetical protein